jgi:hypothetical protein
MDCAAELEEELLLDLNGSPWLTDTPAATSMDNPRASSEDWLQQPATGGNKEKVPRCTLEMVLPLDMAGTMMTNPSSMISSDWESNG